MVAVEFNFDDLPALLERFESGILPVTCLHDRWSTRAVSSDPNFIWEQERRLAAAAIRKLLVELALGVTHGSQICVCGCPRIRRSEESKYCSAPHGLIPVAPVDGGPFWAWKPVEEATTEELVAVIKRKTSP